MHCPVVLILFFRKRTSPRVLFYYVTHSSTLRAFYNRAFTTKIACFKIKQIRFFFDTVYLVFYVIHKKTAILFSIEQYNFWILLYTGD
jgi:hypothetical protein